MYISCTFFCFYFLLPPLINNFISVLSVQNMKHIIKSKSWWEGHDRGWGGSQREWGGGDHGEIFSISFFMKLMHEMAWLQNLYINGFEYIFFRFRLLDFRAWTKIIVFKTSTKKGEIEANNPLFWPVFLNLRKPCFKSRSRL